MARAITLLCEADIATVELLRQTMRYLNESSNLTFEVHTGGYFGELDLKPDAFPLIVRSCDAETLRLAKTFRRAGIAYGFYLDDNFWLLDPQTVLGRHYRSGPIRRQLEWIVAHASVVVAATPLLADYVRQFNPHVEVRAAHFDLSLVPTLPRVRQRKTIRAGFAASLHRGSDLAHVTGAILRALDQHEDLEFEVIGPQEGIPEHPRMKAFPYVDSYRNYVALVQSRGWDFALAPLGPAVSNRYKTDNKFREYAAQGIPGIYEMSPPYAALRDGETGLLVGGGRTWDEAIETYVTDRPLRLAVRRAARRDVEARCSLATVAPPWGALIAAQPEPASAPGYAAARRAVATPLTALQRRVDRARVLWAVGVIAREEHGLLAVAGMTVRFVWKRLAHLALTAVAVARRGWLRFKATPVGRFLGRTRYRWRVATRRLTASRKETS